MNSTKNVAIAALCVSAAILATILILMGISTSPALADASIRGGDYIMVTGALTNATDLLYVVDIAAQKMNVYGLQSQNTQTRALDLLDQVDLRQVFGSK